jgi:predicted DNA-binding transcriptional regulator AlpA
VAASCAPTTRDTSSSGYHCAGKTIAEGRGEYCLRVGARAIDEAVANAFLQAVTPAAVEATLEVVRQLQVSQDAALSQWRLAVERARYETERAERRYRMVEPENRLVARGLETECEGRLRELFAAEAELLRREQQQARVLTPEQVNRLHMLGDDLRKVWSAPTTTIRDRKELLRTLLEEVTVAINRREHCGKLTLRWRGDAITQLHLSLPRARYSGIRTNEDTLDLLRRLAAHYSDDVVAGILNRQGRRTATGERFTAGHVGSLRRYRNIPRFQAPDQPAEGELVNVRKAAAILGLAPSTILRWLEDGFIAGEQITPGAPWQIRMTEQLRARFVDQTPAGYLPMIEATKKLGVSRQTVLQRVKRGELEAVHLGGGKRKGLRIKVIDDQPELFNGIS